ncbi:MAG: PilX N-terminal domain-containing pilus assembly protein [Nitrospiria bacterium]
MMNRIKHIKNENGAALITMLLFLAVLTVIGLTSVSITSLENRTAQNERVYETRINNEEGGVDPQITVLENTILSGTIPATYLAPTGPVVVGANLQNEITSQTREADDVTLSGALGADMQLTLGATPVNMDIDYLFTKLKAGSAIEFASGNEGAGAGSGGGGTEIYYQLVSEATVGNGNGSITNYYNCVVSGACQK